MSEVVGKFHLLVVVVHSMGKWLRMQEEGQLKGHMDGYEFVLYHHYELL